MPNIQDVAKQAGVSISTVSRVLNGTAKVNNEVKKRVEASIQALDYQPNPAARSLRTNHSRIIGLLISDIQNPFFMRLIQGVEDEAQRHDYSLILCNSNENPQREQQYLEVLYSERVAGAIIVPTRERLDEVTLNKFKERNVPIVVVDRRVKDKHVDAVLVDNVRGAYEAVAHLVSNGYRRIGAITGPLTVTTGRDRLEGYRQALRDAGIYNEPALERSGNFDVATGQKLAGELLQLSPPIDALFLGNNLLTLGAWKAIHAHNLKVPGDIGLVGYDETYWSSLDELSLTTVTQPVYELGSAAFLRLYQHLQNPAIESRQEVLLAATLTVRGSSLPRPVLPIHGTRL
jgi:DNA-binding LacI/PurR family transcriptional regulator